MSTPLPEWSLGDRLRARREQLKMGVRELAEAAGVNKGTIVNAESNRPITDQTLQKLADALRAPIDWLRNGPTR